MNRIFIYIIIFCAATILILKSEDMCCAGSKLESGRIILVFNDGVSEEEAVGLANENKIEIEHIARTSIWRNRPHMIVIVPQGQEEAWANKLMKYSQVKYASQCNPYVMPSEGDTDYCEWPTN